MLNFIESLAEKLVKKRVSSELKGYVSFEILPYQENEYGIAHRASFLHNFSSISEEIIFSVQGNAGSIRLYLFAPVKYQQYIENVFYANFPTSDLLLVSKTFPDKKLKYFKFSK